MTIRVENHLTLGRLKTRVREVAPEALAEGMEHVRAIATPRTPVETGYLVGSAHVTVDAAEQTAALTWDGPYARYQNFRVDLRHETGQALYASSSIIDGAEGAVAVMGKRIKDAL